MAHTELICQLGESRRWIGSKMAFPGNVIATDFEWRTAFVVLRDLLVLVAVCLSLLDGLLRLLGSTDGRFGLLDLGELV